MGPRRTAQPRGLSPVKLFNVVAGSVDWVELAL